jgi:hypothetical protein
MRTTLMATALSLTALTILTKAALAQHGGHTGHSGHAGQQSSGPYKGHPYTQSQSLHPGSNPAFRLPHYANGPRYNRGYTYRGVAYKHWCYDGVWRGYTKRWWYRPAGCFIYWSAADGCWYRWVTADGVFVRMDTLTTAELPPADVDDNPPLPPQ